MKVYLLTRTPDGSPIIWVKVDGEPCYALNPEASLKIANHSPSGFEWGYGGSGPSQTALAILLDFTNNPPLADKLHQQFKWDVISQTERPGRMITADFLGLWLRKQEKAPASEAGARQPNI